MKIDLKVWQNEDKIVISIKDSEAKINPAMLDQGVGLTVTKKRVEHLCGEFVIQDGGIRISI